MPLGRPAEVAAALFVKPLLAIQRHIRREAANRAKCYLKEFADETDVQAAMQDFILIMADEIRAGSK